MLMQPAPTPMPQTALRPIVATVVMLLLLYSLFSGDWSAGGPHGPARRADLLQLGAAEVAGSPASEDFPSMHEKVGVRDVKGYSSILDANGGGGGETDQLASDASGCGCLGDGRGGGCAAY